MKNLQNIPVIGELLNQFAANKKKAVVAVGLLVLMAIMWGKALLKKDTAGPAKAADSVAAEQTDTSVKLEYIDLPYDPQRHATLAGDMFKSNNWQGFRPAGQSAGSYNPNIYEISAAAGQNEPNTILADKISREIRLEAIMTGPRPEVFINDKMIGEGQDFTVKISGTDYKITVLKIYENKVDMKCADIVFTQKIAGQGD